MSKSKRDTKPDSKKADRGEAPALMEPLVLSSESKHRPALTDLALEVAVRSAGLRSSLPPGIRAALAELVRAMNCYYSNLIEGHVTHPIDIERALKKDYETDRGQRDLQLEALAHIAVQEWIDLGGLKGRVVNVESIREIHRRFREQLPPDLLMVNDPDTGETLELVPGELRTRYVKIGRHVAISPGAVPRFLTRYEHVYGNLGHIDTVIAPAATHHRLVWIHPFPGCE